MISLSSLFLPHSTRFKACHELEGDIHRSAGPRPAAPDRSGPHSPVVHQLEQFASQHLATVSREVEELRGEVRCEATTLLVG